MNLENELERVYCFRSVQKETKGIAVVFMMMEE